MCSILSFSEYDICALVCNLINNILALMFIFQKLYSSDKHISGLAVDWIWNSVYWTTEEKGKIKRMDTNRKNEKTILRHLTRPSFIAVDPTNR